MRGRRVAVSRVDFLDVEVGGRGWWMAFGFRWRVLRGQLRGLLWRIRWTRLWMVFR